MARTDDHQTSDLSAIASGALQGALKIGKSAAGSLKGAAAGPYGAAAGLIWANRRTVAKIVAALAFLLCLPLLFILMLPSLIFGGLDAAPAEAPILNDNAAIVQNIADVRDRLDRIVADAMTETLAEIDQDFTRSSGDQKFVNNPYTTVGTDGIVDPLLIICQYCAANNADYRTISPDDLERLFRTAQGRLFSWSKREETVAIPVEPPADTEDESTEESEEEEEVPETIEELHIHYTITYNGTAYFADEVFALNDTQKDLAAQYSDNLLLFLGGSTSSVSGSALANLQELLEKHPFTGGSAAGFASPFPEYAWRSLVSSEFGERTDPLNGASGAFHLGIDLAPGYGSTIHACLPGVVAFAQATTGSYGTHVMINHGNGLVTLYAHCSALLVTEGTTVEAGTPIARVGNTGRVTGPHLHLEVIQNGSRQNPRDYLP